MADDQITAAGMTDVDLAALVMSAEVVNRATSECWCRGDKSDASVLSDLRAAATKRTRVPADVRRRLRRRLAAAGVNPFGPAAFGAAVRSFAATAGVPAVAIWSDANRATVPVGQMGLFAA